MDRTVSLFLCAFALTVHSMPRTALRIAVPFAEEYDIENRTMFLLRDLAQGMTKSYNRISNLFKAINPEFGSKTHNKTTYTTAVFDGKLFTVNESVINSDDGRQKTVYRTVVQQPQGIFPEGSEKEVTSTVSKRERVSTKPANPLAFPSDSVSNPVNFLDAEDAVKIINGIVANRIYNDPPEMVGIVNTILTNPLNRVMSEVPVSANEKMLDAVAKQFNFRSNSPSNPFEPTNLIHDILPHIIFNSNNKKSFDFNMAPIDSNKASAASNKAPTNFNKAPTDYNKAPTDFKTPAAFNKAPTDYNKAPAAFNKAPTGYNKAPAAFNNAPTDYNKAPAAFNKAPTDYKKAPTNFNQASSSNIQANLVSPAKVVISTNPNPVDAVIPAKTSVHFESNKPQLQVSLGSDTAFSK